MSADQARQRAEQVVEKIFVKGRGFADAGAARAEIAGAKLARLLQQVQRVSADKSRKVLSEATKFAKVLREKLQNVTSKISA